MGLLHIYDGSDSGIVQTMQARGGNRTTCPVPATADGLLRALDGIRASGKYYDRVLFETHGSPGSIYFGNYAYTAAWWGAVTKRGYTYMVTSNARIYFNGCNVADGSEGWAFLAAVASVFLTPGGGEVFGQTSLGFANPISGHVIHLWGSTRRIIVANDGRILEYFEQ